MIFSESQLSMKLFIPTMVVKLKVKVSNPTPRIVLLTVRYTFSEFFYTYVIYLIIISLPKRKDIVVLYLNFPYFDIWIACHVLLNNNIYNYYKNIYNNVNIASNY